MRIAHNIMSMNANRQIQNTTLAMTKSLEKLSSGYRVNRAADDAAGLAVSEGMRAQISAMGQAIKNAQDGISLIQSTEGTLDEIHTMLRRISDLAEQAANDIYTAAQRAQIQIEVNRLIEEIDRIIEASNFNNMRLLRGVFSGATIRVLDAITQQRGVSGASAFIGQYIIKKMTEAGFSGYSNGVVDAGDVTSGSARKIAAQWLEFNYHMNDLAARGATGATLGSWGSFYLRLAASNLGLDATPLSATQASNDMIALYRQFGYIEMYRAEALAILDRFAPTRYDTHTAVLSGTDNPATYDWGTIQFRHRNATNFTNLELMNDVTGGTTPSAGGYGAAGALVNVRDWDGLNAQAVSSALGLTRAESTNISVGGAMVLHVGPMAADYKDVINGAVSNQIQEVAHGANVLPLKVAQMNSFTIGKTRVTELLADGNRNLAVLQSMQDQQVGQRGIGSVVTLRALWIDLEDPHQVEFSSRGVLTQLAAEDALNIARQAIDDVSNLRADLGAMQNRLESTIRSLRVSEENLQAAESRIRDVDIAAEMVEFTRTQILTQSGLAMLAQANQVPQAVLALLR
ncbi:MAG: flagellin N-terminal helical domain-containing protein [bacterium]